MADDRSTDVAALGLSSRTDSVLPYHSARRNDGFTLHVRRLIVQEVGREFRRGNDFATSEAYFRNLVQADLPV